MKIFRKSIKLLLPVLGAISSSQPAISKETDQPNVILILCDDMGYSDLGCYGSEIKTPNLDKLASEGLRMTQFYNTARCCPTRASLLTGLYPHQAGVGAMDHDQGTPAYRGYLSDHCLTLAEVLKDAGYNTYMSGKWHVGHEKGHWPTDRGFDRYYGLINGASNYFNKKNYRDTTRNWTFLLDDQEVDVPETTMEMWERNEGYYTTDAFTDYAMQFLDQNKKSDNPFFLYLAYTAPHWPLHAFPEDIAKYRGKYKIGWDSLRVQRYQRQLELGVIDSEYPLSQRSEEVIPWEEASEKVKDEFDLEMGIFSAMIDRVDQNIGRLLQKLHDIGADENTLIMFLSDNGGCHTTPFMKLLQGTPGSPESFPCYGFMGANVSNVPFRLQKQFIHEGGISTPFIAWYPQMIKASGLDNHRAHVIDIMPTLVDLCGAQYPVEKGGMKIKPMEGVSLRPVFEKKKLKRDTPIFWEHVGNRGVRIGDWKLVAAKPSLKWELYNMKEDRTELHDLSNEMPEKREEMIRIYTKWADENGVLPWKGGKKRH